MLHHYPEDFFISYMKGCLESASNMNLLFIQVSVVFFAMCFTFMYSQQEPRLSDEEFLSILRCAATSGNQELCDMFLYCDKMLPLPYNTAYANCTAKITPNGIGRCTQNEELYFSEENRVKINNCIESMAANVTLTEAQKVQKNNFRVCMRQLGRKCFGRQV